MKNFISVFDKRALLITIALFLLQSCKYYEPILKTEAPAHPELLNELQGKALIIHGKKGIYLLAQPSIDSGRQEISGLLASIPPEHTTYLNDAKQKYRYKPATSKVLSEVHLYAPIDTIKDRGSEVIIPLSAVERMVIIKPNKALNTMSVVGWVLLAWVVIGTVYVIINPPFTGF
jgi:hypothetical protein